MAWRDQQILFQLNNEKLFYYEIKAWAVSVNNFLFYLYANILHKEIYRYFVEYILDGLKSEYAYTYIH